MPVARFLQSTFASGEFDPLLSSREDVGFFYSSAKTLSNVTPLPQGGAKRREGLRAAGKARGLITEVNMAGYAFTAPEGGTAVNMISTSSNLLTTGDINTATAFVVGRFDAGAAQRVTLCSITASLIGALTTGTLSMQSSPDDTTWTPRASMVIGDNADSRRFALAPDTDLGSFRYWRFIIDNPTAVDFGVTNVQIQAVEIFTEAGYSQSGAVAANSKIRKITTSIDDEYFAVITAGNVDIYTDAGVWQAAVAIPHGDAVVPFIKSSQNLDTLIIYHEDFTPHSIQRLDKSDGEWRSLEFVFDSVAQFPFPDSTANGRNEKQEINFTSMAAGDRLVFEFNGDISPEMIWSATAATNATNFATTVEALEDITDVTVISLGNDDYTFEFVGEDANRFFATLIVDLLDGSGTAFVSRKVYGRTKRENLWGQTRGFPRCGTFYQGRHWMGGFKGRPDVIIGSRAGAIDEFKEDADPVATSPLVLVPDIDEQVTIENIYPGRNLQIFTSSAELFIPDEPITPTNVALKITSKRGSSSYGQPVDVQGGTLFIDRNGTALREYLFTETEQSYTAEPVSTLGGHLINNPTDMALRRSVDTDKPTILYVINTGRDRDFNKVPAAAITIDRAQTVTAFARMETDGEFMAVAATQAGQVAFMVQRELGGAEWQYLELMDADHYSDHSVKVANPDLETFTATALQTVFTYTFSNPTDVNDIAVFTRQDTNDDWARAAAADYTLNTGAKTVTFGTGQAVGHLVAISKRATTITTGTPELDGVVSYVHVDGRPVGAHTPASGSVTIAGDEGFFFFALVGLRMVPTVTMQAYKGQGGQSPTMQKQRIFRAVLSMDRTSNIAISMETGTPRAVALTDYDAGTFDLDLDDILFTGVKRVSGIGSWQLEPRVTITQTEPGPFVLRSIAYDIRF